MKSITINRRIEVKWKKKYRFEILIKVIIIEVIICAAISFHLWSMSSSSFWSAYISFCLLLTKLSFWFERCEAFALPTSPCSMFDDSLIDFPCSSSGSGSSKRELDESTADRYDPAVPACAQLRCFGLLSFCKYEIEKIALSK